MMAYQLSESNKAYDGIDYVYELGCNEDEIPLVKGGKAPKLRFRPGNIVELETKLYEVLFSYRLVKHPHEWMFCLGEKADMTTPANYYTDRPQVVYDLFFEI